MHKLSDYHAANNLLLFGGLFLIIAALQTYTGKAGGRGVIYSRDKEPRQFWLTIGMYVLMGIFIIAYSFSLTR